MVLFPAFFAANLRGCEILLGLSSAIMSHTASDQPWDFTSQDDLTFDMMLFHADSVVPMAVRGLASCLATNCFREIRIFIVFSYGIFSGIAGTFGFRSFYVMVYVWMFTYLKIEARHRRACAQTPHRLDGHLALFDRGGLQTSIPVLHQLPMWT